MGNIDKFDLSADRYDTTERIEVAKITGDAIRRYIDGYKNGVAIDYGCGTGLIGLQFVDMFKSICFIDASANMTEKIKQKISEYNIKNSHVLCCDFANKCPDGLKADVILVVQVLLHEKNIEHLLKNMYAALNENGRLIIVDFDKNANVISEDVHDGFDQSDLAKMLQTLSFKNIESHTFHFAEKFFMKQDASLFILKADKD